MRRLAKQSREDKYPSQKDYQIITRHKTLTINLPDDDSRIVFEKGLTPSESRFVGFGGYVKPSSGCKARVSLVVKDEVVGEKEFNLKAGWNRIGLAMHYNGEDSVSVIIQLKGKARKLEVWGLDCDVLTLPEVILDNGAELEQLESRYVCPETFYLPHDNALNLDVNGDLSSTLSIASRSGTIELKKCAYDGRLLPLESKLLGSLAFHKHNDKRTKHQNECRSCKKWRINDDFNPTRTVDQLHESSVITRERKLLLQEPAILQEIKNRHGAGLKSIVWERFGKQCFKCGEPVELDGFQLDHTRPLAYLWPIDEFATCLCNKCNNLKKEKFPCDFYSDDELHRLSEITGLPYEELIKKDVNEHSLRMIIENIRTFANTWSARTFNATARKVKELRHETDLFEILRAVDEDAFGRIQAELRERPEDEEEDLSELFQE